MICYWRYFKYVVRHKWYVLKECFKVGLYWRGLIHDLSKFRPHEFIPYARHFYGTPEREEKYRKIAETRSGYLKTYDIEDFLFNQAWLFHIHVNAHHWQFWLLTQDEDEDLVLDMPDRYVKEMICDWKGAAKAQGRKWFGELQEWYLSHRHKMRLSEKTRLQVEELIGLNLPREVR